MRIRYGNYTIYNGHEVQLIEARQEMPIPFTHFILKWMEGEICPFSEFKKNEHGSVMLVLKKEEVNNAFFISTKAFYKGEVFDVEPYFGDKIHLHLATKNEKTGKLLGFYELHDSYGAPYYLGEIKISDIGEIWEVREESSYDIPLPIGLELVKIIKVV